MSLCSPFHRSQSRRTGRSSTTNGDRTTTPVGHASRARRLGRACLETLEDRRFLSFAPAASFPIGPNPQAVATADLNKDGRVDLVTSNPGDNTISVLLGDGGGGFGPAAHFNVHVTAGADQATLAIADFTGDGDLDVVTVQKIYNYGDVSRLPGNGDGTFGQATNIGGGATSAAAGHFNADGNIDLVVSAHDELGYGYLQTFLSDGGGFTYPASHVMPSAGAALALGHIDGDGTLDVLRLMPNGWVVPGNGDGTFFRPYLFYGIEFPTAPGESAVALGDFTGDDNLDAVIVSQTVDIHRGHGNGSFDGPTSHTANGAAHTAVATGDFDVDGKLDAVVTDADTGTVSVMLGNGDGTLRFAGAFATGSSPSGVAVGDFNGDGRIDVAATTGGSNTVSVLLNDGNWGPEVPPPPPPLLRIGHAMVTEENVGTADARFTVTLSAASDRDVTFRYATADGTATAGVDYAAASGLVTIPAGQTSATIAVAVHGDRIFESSESFSVLLTEPTDAVIAEGWAFATIVDDEPSISVGDARLTEGNSGVTYATFTVSLSLAYDEPVSVDFATADGTATAGGDYQAAAGTLTFAAGETTKTVRIAVFGDTLIENDEYFSLDLGGPSGNAFIADGRAHGTIANDDFPTPRKRGKNK